MKRAFEYKMTLFNESVDNEYDVEGAVFAKNFGDAIKKLEDAYTYNDPNHKHGVEICDIYVKEYLDPAGEPTDIYETKGFFDYQNQSEQEKEEYKNEWKGTVPGY
jgi:hypothetical protein